MCTPNLVLLLYMRKICYLIRLSFPRYRFSELKYSQ